VFVAVCSINYPEGNVNATYFHLSRPALQYFSTISQKGHHFPGKSLNIKCAFLFFLQPLAGIFLIVGINERDMIKKYVLVFI
jgi:hypothetical protein